MERYMSITVIPKSNGKNFEIYLCLHEARGGVQLEFFFFVHAFEPLGLIFQFVQLRLGGHF